MYRTTAQTALRVSIHDGFCKIAGAYISFVLERSQIKRTNRRIILSYSVLEFTSSPPAPLRCNLHQRSYGSVTRHMRHTASSASHVCSAVTRMHRCRRSHKREPAAAVWVCKNKKTQLSEMSSLLYRFSDRSGNDLFFGKKSKHSKSLYNLRLRVRSFS